MFADWNPIDYSRCKRQALLSLSSRRLTAMDRFRGARQGAFFSKMRLEVRFSRFELRAYHKIILRNYVDVGHPERWKFDPLPHRLVAGRGAKRLRKMTFWKPHMNCPQPALTLYASERYVSPNDCRLPLNSFGYQGRSNS